MFRQKSEPSTSKDESWASPYHRVQTDRVTSRFEFFVGFFVLSVTWQQKVNVSCDWSVNLADVW